MIPIDAVIFVHKADNAILQPLFALFVDQWTTRVTITEALAGLRTGAQHVLRHPIAIVPLRLAELEGNCSYHGLPQHPALVSIIYARKQNDGTEIGVVKQLS